MMVERTAKGCNWTREEDDVLRLSYPQGGAGECVPLLPGRTYAAITTRAVRCLGLQRMSKTIERRDQLHQIAITAHELFAGEFSGAVIRQGNTANVICDMLRELAAHRNAAGTSE